MNNKEKIKKILIEELSKCNNFNYYIEIGNLYLTINTKKLYQSLIDNSFYFEGGIDSKVLFKQYESKNLYLSYYDIWSKFEKKTQLKYLEIQSIVKDVLEEGFSFSNVYYDVNYSKQRLTNRGMLLGKRFKLKGITPMIYYSHSSNIFWYGLRFSNKKTV